ncbi:hypothetical protein CYMTET_7319 [Cymbomonas tetramitiformis]|uniref:Uncharacterized protein n=1 Tax=Cymbomonas tetramitiformis TaxID=36881 RepID=A0AAE0GX78_9CHLO|nr:hypothetical protein CYMTET_7319 [Cymbomonas tetramitiformis]
MEPHHSYVSLPHTGAAYAYHTPSAAPGPIPQPQWSWSGHYPFRSDIPTPYMSVAPLTTAYTGRPQHDPASIAYGERAVQMVLQRRQEAEYAAHVSAAYPPQPCRAAALEGIMEVTLLSQSSTL